MPVILADRPGTLAAKPLAEELKVGCNVVESDLYPVAAGPLEPNQLVNHVLEATDDLDVATKRAVLVAMSLPCNRVAGSLMRDKAFDCPRIGGIENGLMVALRLAIGFAADNHRVHNSAQLPAALGAGGLNQRRQTVIVKAPRSFVEQVLWPEFQELSGALTAYLAEITERLIREEAHGETADAEEREEPRRLT
jgi:hypothetical protein